MVAQNAACVHLMKLCRLQVVVRIRPLSEAEAGELLLPPCTPQQLDCCQAASDMLPERANLRMGQCQHQLLISVGLGGGIIPPQAVPD